MSITVIGVIEERPDFAGALPSAPV